MLLIGPVSLVLLYTATAVRRLFGNRPAPATPRYRRTPPPRPRTGRTRTPGSSAKATCCCSTARRRDPPPRRTAPRSGPHPGRERNAGPRRGGGLFMVVWSTHPRKAWPNPPLPGHFPTTSRPPPDPKSPPKKLHLVDGRYPQSPTTCQRAKRPRPPRKRAWPETHTLYGFRRNFE